MKNQYRFLNFLLTIIFLITLYPNNSFGQNEPTTTEFPASMTPYDWRLSLGYSAIKLPEDVYLEAAAIKFPLIKFAAVMGLPENFLLDGKIATELVTNQFELGGRWVYKFNDQLHGDVGYSLAYLYGQLKQFAYDSKISGWTSYPTIAIGYDWGNLALTLRGTISLINSIQSTSGTTTEDFAAERYNGFFYRVTLEQRFYKNTTIGLGFQMNYLRFYYPEWLMFPTFDRFYWIPEFQVMFSL